MRAFDMAVESLGWPQVPAVNVLHIDMASVGGGRRKARSAARGPHRRRSHAMMLQPNRGSRSPLGMRTPESSV